MRQRTPLGRTSLLPRTRGSCGSASSKPPARPSRFHPRGGVDRPSPSPYAHSEHRTVTLPTRTLNQMLLFMRVTMENRRLEREEKAVNKILTQAYPKGGNLAGNLRQLCKLCGLGHEWKDPLGFWCREKWMVYYLFCMNFHQAVTQNSPSSHTERQSRLPSVLNMVYSPLPLPSVLIRIKCFLLPRFPGFSLGIIDALITIQPFYSQSCLTTDFNSDNLH